ncbi:winged helix-turn-helix transcriptional regulator [Alloacidobacterium dinghuense]|uniref:Winged helix-turn-helix transcriptional regulator n=1 Tax=Alloacidobacterium dinghuense TaxID=2763107 RepID=A0A7G8BHP4_9BACT|nr:winged helix-turn-helix transcriptional regulator [Alloacidobacterium dinghuense]
MVPGEDNHRAEALEPDLSEAGFRQLAEFRHRIRQFLRFSEEAARSKGIEPHQHQLLLALKGLPKGTRPTVTALSQQLCIRHHSTVELVNRLVDQGAIRRRPGDHDHREVLVELTAHGETLLHRLSVLHREELRVSGPALSKSLWAVVHHSGRGSRRPA